MARLKDKVAFITGSGAGAESIARHHDGRGGADIIAVDIGQGKPATSGVPSVLGKTVAEVEKRGRRIVARAREIAPRNRTKYFLTVAFISVI